MAAARKNGGGRGPAPARAEGWLSKIDICFESPAACTPCAQQLGTAAAHRCTPCARHALGPQ
eukprot:1339112-Rhodomonas_salina.2